MAEDVRPMTDEEREQYFVDFEKRKYVPPFLLTDPVLSQIYKTQGYEIGKINYYIDDLLNQAFITTATWGLKYWEEEFGIPTNENDSYELRRARVLSKKRGQGVTNVHKLKQVSKSFLHPDDSVDVELHNEEYYYWIYLNSEHGFSKEPMTDLYNAIDEINPCHLETRYRFCARTKTNLKVVSCERVGEMITTYPYIVPEIHSTLTICTGANESPTVETVTNYPKEIPVKEKFYVVDSDGNNVIEDTNNKIIE